MFYISSFLEFWSWNEVRALSESLIIIEHLLSDEADI